MSTLSYPLAPQAAPAAASIVRPSITSLMHRLSVGAWRALESMGRARAQRHLEALASQYEPSQPQLAAQLRAASLHNTRV